MTSTEADTASLLRGKRVLVIGRDYFFYTREIADELRSGFGAAVNFHPIEPRNFLYKLLRKIRMPSRWWLERYHRKVIAHSASECPDLVLFIQVHQIGDLVGKYREAFGTARFVLYYWDSIKTHDYRAYTHFFDQVFTFDRLDAERVPGLVYLPLFFSERFRSLRQERAQTYDVSFVGVAVTTRRYDQLVKLRGWAKANGVRLYDYVVVSPVLYVKRLIQGQLLRGVHFKSLGEQELLAVYSGSGSILDLPNNEQTGFTMRTFEALGAHRKLITANRNIVDEDFYTSDSVYVIGPGGEMPDSAFLHSEPKFSTEVERYCLHSWVLRLLAPILQGNRTADDAC